MRVPMSAAVYQRVQALTEAAVAAFGKEEAYRLIATLRPETESGVSVQELRLRMLREQRPVPLCRAVVRTD